MQLRSNGGGAGGGEYWLANIQESISGREKGSLKESCWEIFGSESSYRKPYKSVAE